MRLLKTSKLVVFCLIATVLLAGGGLGYAQAAHTADVTGTVQACYPTPTPPPPGGPMPVLWAVSNDNGSETSTNPAGYTGSNHIDIGDDGIDPSPGNPPFAPYSPPSPQQPGGTRTTLHSDGKNVGVTTAAVASDGNSFTATLANAYPYYYPTIFFGVQNSQSTPATIRTIDIYINGILANTIVPVANGEIAYSTLSAANQVTAYLQGIYLTQTVAANAILIGELGIEVEQVAEMSHTYTVKIVISMDGPDPGFNLHTGCGDNDNQHDWGHISCDPDNGGWYNKGTSVHVTACPNPGYHFDHWGGDCSGGYNPNSLTMTGNKTVTAYFAADPVLANVVLTSNNNPCDDNQTVTFKAVVSGSKGTSTGRVTFKDGGNAFGSAYLSQGTATYSTSYLDPGSHSITAVYGGDSNYGSSTSPALTQKVLHVTNVTLTSNANPAVYGQSITFKASLASGATGQITFWDGSKNIGTGTISNGTATLVYSLLPAGSHTITASYAGDANYSDDVSNSVTQQVNKAGTSTALTTANSSVKKGTNVVFTATVSDTSPGSVTATGTVTVKDGSTTLGTGTLNSSGQATYTFNSSSVASHTITAVYAGDSNFNGSTSPSMTEKVTN